MHVVQSEKIGAIFEGSQIELDCCGHSDGSRSDVSGCKGIAGGKSEGGQNSLVVPLLHCSVFVAEDDVVPD